MENIIFNAVLLLISIGGFLLGKFVFPNVPKSVADKLRQLAAWADKFVVWAREFMKTSSGHEKMEMVVEQLEAIAKEAGLNVTKDQLRAIAQAAYENMMKGAAEAQQPHWRLPGPPGRPPQSQRQRQPLPLPPCPRPRFPLSARLHHMRLRCRPGSVPAPLPARCPWQPPRRGRTPPAARRAREPPRPRRKPQGVQIPLRRRKGRRTRRRRPRTASRNTTTHKSPQDGP